MFMTGACSEVFGAQQRHQHVDRHGRGSGDVEDGDKHGLDPPQQDGIDREQREHGRADGNENEIHWKAPISGAAHLSHYRIKVRRLLPAARINEI
jgi:hypothetical protein